ncbi:MAG: hypothetical protein WA958_10410 [Tunicatimonas sp.]
MKVYLREDTRYHAPIRYVLKIIEKNRNIQFEHVGAAGEATIVWDDRSPLSEPICTSFYQHLPDQTDHLKHQSLLDADLLIKQSGQADLIATIFYLINCLQEASPSPEELDEFGRYKFSASYQSKFNVIESNLVERLIDTFCEGHGIKGTKHKSTFFVSHDIDTLYGSLLQDGFWALKKMNIGVILKLIAYELGRAPHWRNIDRIIRINSEYDIRTTFFWLVNKGRGLQGIMNADYNLKNEQDLLERVDQSGNTNGLHKSCSTMSIDEELARGNLATTYNRYHFLNFLPHRDWEKISASALNFDASLGFAERCGFRNSYGRAFQPFNVRANCPYNFVEAPLHFMDVTMHKYMQLPRSKMSQLVIDFYERYPENCDFSLLWHNTYFTDYKYSSFIEEYKKIVSFIYENKVACVSPRELIEKNTLTW